jgi:hypothetical protein
MTNVVLSRRSLVTAGGAVVASGVASMLLPAHANGLAPTPSMWGAPTITVLAHRSSIGSVLAAFG